MPHGMDEVACCSSPKSVQCRRVAMSPPVPSRNPLRKSPVRSVPALGRRRRCRQEPSLQLSFKGREWTGRQAPSLQHQTSCFTLNEAGTDSMRIRYHYSRPEFQGLGRLGTPSRPRFRSSPAHFSHQIRQTRNTKTCSLNDFPHANQSPLALPANP